MNWGVEVTKKALKEIRRMSKKDAERLLSVLEKISLNPYQGDVRKIKGEDDTWRRRIGSYRLIYKVVPKENCIFVFKVTKRTTITYRKRK